MNTSTYQVDITPEGMCFKSEPSLFLLLLFIYLFIYLFIFGCVGSHCCAWASSSCGERGLLFIVVCGLLIVVASLVAEQGL